MKLMSQMPSSDFLDSQFLSCHVRIPMKPAIDSDLKPASHSDFIPASIPI
jgi:hypothetical protein